MRKIYNKISLSSKIVNFALRMINYKKNYDTVEDVKKYIQKLSKKQNNSKVPDKLNLRKEIVNGIPVYCYRGTIDDHNKKLLYVHGGSFIEEANYFQLKFAMQIADKTNSTLIFPIYKLAPKGTYKDMYPLMENIYNRLLRSSKEINFLGDSAGGGFILSFAMYLRDKRILLPRNVIAMSPWLDISLSNPETYEDAKKDFMCGVAGTRYCGSLWADDLDPKDPLVSPMFGSFNDLSLVTIIVGESGIFKSDCLMFSEKLKKDSIEHNFIMYRNQGHDFGAYPTKEGKMIIEDISKIIND